ncbi:MAG TPA: PQQ-binding-like beta-propeller repeat protein [Pirellulaceae bacterium]
MPKGCMFFVLLVATSATAADWPQWRGPLGTGQCDEKTAPLTWSPTEHIKWKVALDGPGNSTPIVIGEQVFITHARANSGLRGLHCFDRKTGELKWKHEVEYAEKELTHDTNPPCASSPVSDGERIVAWYGSAGLFAYDLNGKELWHKDLGKVEHIWGFGSSPLIHGDLLVLNFGPGLNAFVAAFDKRTGNEVWRKQFTGQVSEKIDEYRGSWSTPVMNRENGRDVLLLSLPERLWAVEPATGNEIWSCGGPSKLFYTSPLIANDIIIAMCGYTGPALAVKSGSAGDQTDKTLWTHPKNPQRVGSGVVVAGHIYILNEPGLASCIDAKTGDKKWEQRIGGGQSWCSMVHAAGRLYVGNTAGTTFVLEPNPTECKILAENKLGETMRASHAFSDGQVFMRTYKGLYCVE